MGSLTTAHVCSWGINYSGHDASNFVKSGSGILYDFGKNTEPVMAPEHNEIGQVISQTQYDEHGTVNATLQVAHGVTPPDRLSILEVDSKYYYVTSIQQTESNQAYERYSISLERYHRTAQNFVVAPTGAFS